MHVSLNKEKISVEHDLRNINYNINVHLCRGDSA